MFLSISILVIVHEIVSFKERIQVVVDNCFDYF